MYVFLLTIQKNLQNSKRLQIFSTLKATRFYEMSKVVGFQCFFLQKNSILNTGLSLKRCMSRVQRMILPTKI
jgi:hypothetical protein